MSEPLHDPRPDANAWLVLNYRYASKTSQVRMALWRRLKKLGAVQLLPGMAAVPDLPATRTLFWDLYADLTATPGVEAHLMRSEILTSQADLIAEYNAIQTAEYEQLTGLLTEVALDASARPPGSKERQLRQVYTQFAKLTERLDEVRARDCFGAGAAAAACDAERLATTALAALTQEVASQYPQGSTMRMRVLKRYTPTKESR